MTKKGRRSNSASPDDLVKVFRSHLPAGLDKKYLEHDPEQIVANYEEVISDILLRTPRPTKGLLSQTATRAWQDVKASEADAWSERICKDVSYCYSKRLQVTTGVRLSAPVRRIIQQINKNCFKSKKDPAPAKRPLLPHDSSPKAAPKKAAKTEKAPAGQMSAADLLKMYTLEPLPSSNDPQIVEVDSASEISEESDQMKEPANNAAGSAEGQGLQFWDSSKLCMVRSKEGKKVYAKMSEGEGGFLLAQFEGDANPVQTEVPNLVLHGAGMVPEKRPGAAKKAACSQERCGQKTCRIAALR